MVDMNLEYLPENNYTKLDVEVDLNKAMRDGTILHGKIIKCDEELQLYAQITDDIVGIIPVDELQYTVKERREVSKHDVWVHVNRMLTFKVKEIREDGTPILSRKDAQKECYDKFISCLEPGDVVNARVVHTTQSNALCDIGCGYKALLSKDNISIARYNKPPVRLKKIKDFRVVVQRVSREDGLVYVSHTELLNDWATEVAQFNEGVVTVGKVVGIKDYGVIVEISENLTGLARNIEGLKVDDMVCVLVTGINAEEMQVRLKILRIDDTPDTRKLNYHYNFKHGDHISQWMYSPENCAKKIQTHFDKI